MVEVLLINDKSKNDLSGEIFSIISNMCSCMLVSDKTVLKSGKDPEIIISESKSFDNIRLEDYIVILGKSDKSTDAKLIESAHTVIVNSYDKKGLMLAEKLKSQILICGMSVRDTVTISSLIGSSATVSLSRTIEKPDGLMLEEGEICLPNNNYDNYSLMAAGVLSLIK